MGKPDPFLNSLKNKDDARTAKFKDALLWADSEVKTPSGRDFIQSCREQFERKGYLTDRQVEALYEVDANFLEDTFGRERYHDDTYDY
jgi:hypothetical protein